MIADKDNVMTLLENKQLFPSKRLGQNFLISAEIASKAVEALAISDQDEVVEIGSGLGALSEFIIAYQVPTQLYEIDAKMVEHLLDAFKNCSWLKVHHQDFLKAKIDKENEKLVIGNLPYYITTPILEKVLMEIPFKRFVFMVQAEVEERLMAKIGSKEYGPLAIILSTCYEIIQICKAPRQAFYPVPHVDSVIFKITPVKRIEKQKQFYQFLKTMFKMRRKTILNNLHSLVHDKEEALSILNRCGIEMNKRPEELSKEDYLKLWKALA